MTLHELAELAAPAGGLSTRKAELVLRAAFGLMARTLTAGEVVRMVTRYERRGR